MTLCFSWWTDPGGVPIPETSSPLVLQDLLRLAGRLLSLG